MMRFVVCLGMLFALAFGFYPFAYAQQDEATSKVREELISLDVREQSFGEIIEYIREQTGKNILADDEVKTISVTITLNQIPWKKVLEVIAKEHNCLVEDLGNQIIKVSKPPTVTMEFEGADIRDIINHIATVANRNIVISEQVKGTVSLRLKNVPWQDALDAIIKTRGYVIVQEKEGRILRVVPPQEIETQLETRIFKLRFIRPKSIYVAQMTSSYFTKGDAGIGGRPGTPGAAGGTMGTGMGTGVQMSHFSLLSALEAVLTPGKGKINYDDATNTLVITDIKPQLDKMAEIVQELDKEPKQVFLDIKFIRTTNTDLFDFGIDTGDNGIRISQSFGSMATRLPFTLGKGGWEDAIAAVPKSQLDTEGFPSDQDIEDYYGEDNKPVSFGKLDFSETKFTLRLLKKDVKSKVVQAPKIITLDHHEATIFVGRTIAYPATEIIQNENGTTSVELTEAENSPAREGFQILVVPHVIPDTNKIQLTVIPSNDKLTGDSTEIPGLNLFQAGGANASQIYLPEITQQVVVTHMILESGQTAVLGGLLQVSQTETVRKVPFLGDIPFIGYFFKSKSISKEKEDLFIFITPRIVQSAEDTQEKIKATVRSKIDQKRAQYETIWQQTPAENK